MMAPRDELERYEATEAQNLIRLLRALRPPERAVQVPPPVDLTIRAEIWKAQVRRQVIALLSMARRDLIQVIREALTDNPMLEEVAPAEDEHVSPGEKHVPHLTAAADDLTDAEEQYDSIWQACIPDGWDAHDLPLQASEAPSASERPTSSPEALVPDVIVMRVGHDDQVCLNEEGMPRLRLRATSRHWVREGQGGEPEATQYLDDQLRAAVWLIRSVEHRRQTLVKVATSLVKFQREFLDHGLAYVKPLVLKDVAEDIGMHESTVSRVTTSKYMSTEQGIFELTYFFHSGIELYGGETMSSLTVKDRIKTLVAAEDPGQPLTDQQLVEILAADHVKIARRTVTEYRRELELPPANRRHQQRGSAAPGADPAAGASQLSPDEVQRVRQALEAHTHRWLTEPPPLGDREEASGVPPEVEEAQRHRDLAWLESRINLPPVLVALLGESAKMQEVARLLERVLSTTAAVLLTGEPGTGQNRIARLLHDQGPRAQGPFIAVNCAALPETRLEAELFGYARGTFTGATRRKSGRLEQAAGGTLFLDEIDALSPALQAKLLRVLQEQQFERVGGTETLTTDARIVAATNQDLERLIAERRFRSDLFYRLNVYPITLLPLRERQEDLGPLTMHFLKRFSQVLRKDVLGMSKEAMGLIARYSWPGNIQELENVLERAVMLAQGTVVRAQDLPSLRELLRVPGLSGNTFRLPSGGMVLSDVEKGYIRQALEQSHQNKSQAAKLLGLSRTQLRARMRHYGLETD